MTGNRTAPRQDLSDVQIEVSSARPLTAAEQDLVREKLVLLHPGGRITVNMRVDPDLIGGMVVKVGDHIFDGSLRGRLEALKGRLLAHKPDEEVLEFARLPDLLEQLKADLTAAPPPIGIENIGVVTGVGDGIAIVEGLSEAAVGEIVEFPHGVQGTVLDLDRERVSCILLGSEARLKEGEQARRTGRILQVPVGSELLGRVINPLGVPLDGKGPIRARDRRPLENNAPGVVERQPVSVPLQTGLKAVDALVPIGRGQRELIIGDRGTGKTAIAIDTIINQRDKDVICIYVAIGQKASSVARTIASLRAAGALDYSIIVAATASDPPSLQYYAPYAGCAIGEYFMYQGRHVLVVYDDLSKHAIAYRTISLLLKRPPGREAYPGDIFYLHSRLLERAAQLTPEMGGGSLTALPIIETQAGDISSYIPTNVISITDGQIYLDEELFFAGVRPAVRVGLSVSRVGGNAQIKAMRQVAGHLRLDLAQYRELAAFAKFGSDLDRETRAKLDRGERVVEVLKQPQYQPQAVEEQVMILYAAVNGYLDDIRLDAIKNFEHHLLHYLQVEHREIGRSIAATGQLTPETEQALAAAITTFKGNFWVDEKQEKDEERWKAGGK